MAGDVVRRPVAVLVVVLVVAALAGCGGSDPARPDRSGGIRIEHLHGVTTVPATPRRVVALGQADVQIAVALGVELVGAVRDPTSDDGNWPGVEPPLPDDVATFDDDVPNLEQIAMLHPDLILAVSANQAYLDIYDRLDAIAPVVAATHPPMESTGEEVALLIGRALYRDEAARELIARSDRAVAAFAAEHAAWAGTSYALGLWVNGTTYLAAGPELQSSQFLQRLGLRLPAAFGELTGKGRGTAHGLVPLSEERLDVLGAADRVLISTWGSGSREEFTRSPVVVSSGLASSDRLHMISPELASPLLEPNPAVTDYVLRELARELGA